MDGPGSMEMTVRSGSGPFILASVHFEDRTIWALYSKTQLKFLVDSDYNSLSNEAKTEAWKNPENPSVGTKLTCVFGPEKKLPESIPEETVSRIFWYSANQRARFRHVKKSDDKGRQGQKLV